MKEGKGLKLLLIEDELSHAELTMRELKRGDFGSQNVRHEHSGEEGLKALQQEGFDLVLLDYSLPGKSGLDVLRKIKEMDYDIPVIIVTGQGNEKVSVEAMKLGAHDYIIKSDNYLVTLPLLVEKTLEKYQTDKDYRNLEGIYQTIVENSTDAIILADESGIITFYSSGAEGIFGFCPQEMVGIPIADHFVNGGKGKRAWGMVMKSSEGRIHDFETSFSAKGGGEILVSLSMVILYDAKGLITGTLIIGRDITERKRFEEELKKKVDELEKWYRLTVDREVKMAQLKERVEELESELKRNL